MAYISSCVVCGIQTCDTDLCSECKDVAAQALRKRELLSDEQIKEIVEKRRDAQRQEALNKYLDQLSRICPHCGQVMPVIMVK